MSEIDRTMKKHTENLLNVLEGVSAQLLQLESRTRNLEFSVDDLKTSVGNNQGSTDGKMRHLENIMREVSCLFVFPFDFKLICWLYSYLGIISFIDMFLMLAFMHTHLVVLLVKLNISIGIIFNAVLASDT